MIVSDSLAIYHFANTSRVRTGSCKRRAGPFASAPPLRDLSIGELVRRPDHRSFLPVVGLFISVLKNG